MARWREAGSHRRPPRACLVCRKPTSRGGKFAFCKRCDPGPNKHRNEPTRDAQGRLFHGRGEMRRFGELEQWERLGLIRNLTRQAPKYHLVVGTVEITAYIPDATYEAVDLPGIAPGTFIVEDHKSVWTREDPVYQIKRRLMKAIHGIDIQEHIEQRREYGRREKLSA